MKNKSKLLLCVFAFGLANSFAFAQSTKDGVDLFALQNADPQAITIAQAVELALENNSNIQIAQKSAQIYDQQVKQYWSYVYPQINLSGSYTRTLHPQEAITSMGKFRMSLDNATSGTAEATLLLWKGGAVSAGIRMGKYHSQSGYLELAETQNLIKDNVNTLCLGIVLSHALIQVQKENLDIAKDHLKEIEQKYKQGLASDLDVLNQKVKVSNSEPALIQAKNAYEIGLLTLRRLLNKDPQDNLSLKWDLKDIMSYQIPPLEELYEIAQNNRPELIISQLSVKMAKEQINIARADHLGSLTAFANATYTGSSNEVIIPMSSYNSSYGTSVGLRLNIPLFEGFRVSSQVRQKELAYEQALIQAQDTQRNIKIEVKRAWLNLNEAKERIASTKGTIGQARKNLHSTNLRYRNGLASRLDLDDAALLLHDAELQFVQAIHDGFVALSNLNYAVGKDIAVK